jgi:hypothetical protein
MPVGWKSPGEGSQRSPQETAPIPHPKNLAELEAHGAYKQLVVWYDAILSGTIPKKAPIPGDLTPQENEQARKLDGELLKRLNATSGLAEISDGDLPGILDAITPKLTGSSDGKSKLRVQKWLLEDGLFQEPGIKTDYVKFAWQLSKSSEVGFRELTADLHEKAAAHKKERERGFTPISERSQTTASHMHSPLPLSEEAALKPHANTYFFSGEQIRIPGVKSAYDATVRFSAGSGFLASDEGDVLTAAHVVADPGKDAPNPGQLIRADGTTAHLDGKEVIFLGDPRNRTKPDLAAYKLPELSNIPHIPIRPDPVHEGETIYLIGYPKTQSGKVCSTGKVTLIEDGLIRVSAISEEGSSGGPAVDKNGELIGVVHKSDDLFTGSHREVGTFIVPIHKLPKH